jgi:hypothetical protein
MTTNLVVESSYPIQQRIITLRGVQVMLDVDLAELYRVDTKVLNQAVKRNVARFPESFRFQVSDEEYQNLRSQFVTSSEHGGRRYLPFAFTEQGIAMLSAVLRSDVAVQVSIQIMQAFVEMRGFLLNHAAVFQRLATIEQKQQITDQRVNTLFEAMDAGKLSPKQGIFYDGQVYDAYVFVTELIQSAQHDIVIIDNYVDESVLTMLTQRKANISVTILTQPPSPAFALAVKKHNEQYPNVVVSAFKSSHDRFLIIDKQHIYHIGASLKDLGKKWFAFSKLDMSALALLQQAGVTS